MSDEQQTQDLDEGEIAADYVEGLLDIVDLDGDIEIEESGSRTTLKIGEAGDDSLAALSAPEVVSALQDLTRLAVQSQTGEFSRVVLDVAGSQDARTNELRDLVAQAIARIEGGADRAPLPAMSSYERKLVHDLVAEAGYHSESEGEGRDRHAVVVPA
ncbi:Jag family protein [Agrococcus sp. SGAir0287]|uniref:Jag family protein n=1 Tax=Agrococcus sp. SGAir0287 TaxID=2070347 RepID=UPI0010CD35BC|nr:R3H domain-containing nucleic acid-binding protein [Agrococcus sp. SGAir0287]QCR20552.1 DNA-binding protein [Agrococcus sp. SGAir0287]